MSTSEKHRSENESRGIWGNVFPKAAESRTATHEETKKAVHDVMERHAKLLSLLANE